MDGYQRYRKVRRYIMNVKDTCSKLSIMVGIIAAMIVLNHSAFAATVKVQGSNAGTFVTANFTYDGVAPAISITYTGQDNLGGSFTGQDIGEYSVTTRRCTAPDGSAGTVFVLVRATEVDTYNQGQLYSAGAGAAAGIGCESNTTGSFGLIETHSVMGGTGKFASASGSIMHKVTGKTLAAPGSPPGKRGEFGAVQATRTGSVTD
jgi:hypothetical protein